MHFFVVYTGTSDYYFLNIMKKVIFLVTHFRK